MPKDEVSNKKRTEVKTKKDIKQEWETEGKGLGYDTPEEYFNDFYGPLEMNTGGITGAAVTEKEYKDLKKLMPNDKVKKFSGAAVSEKEYEDLKKGMKKGGMTKGQKKIRTVMREFKAKKLKSSSGQKVTNPKQAIAIALSEAGQSKKMKKAKGGSFITKGGDYIKDLL
jgi:hypothetical protein